jgi:hypothetical protein
MRSTPSPARSPIAVRTEPARFERSRVGHAPPAAGRAESPALAAERDETLVRAGGAAHTHEAMGENSALEVARELAGDEGRYLTAGILRMREERAQLLRDDAVQHRVFGNSPGVSGAPRLRPYRWLCRRLHRHRRARRRPRWSMTSAISSRLPSRPPGLYWPRQRGIRTRSTRCRPRPHADNPVDGSPCIRG